MEKPVRERYECRQCQRVYPSYAFRHIDTCIFCLDTMLKDSLTKLHRKTLKEQYELINRALMGYWHIASNLGKDLAAITSIILEKE